MDKKQVSKSMSYWLRHNPSDLGIILDDNGWTDLETFLEKSYYDREIVEQVVAECDKQRFSIQNGRIRANQGHSVDLSIDFEEVEPKSFLWHGTVDRFMESIFREGLKPMSRHHVHLSSDAGTAFNVGARRGDAVILRIDAQRMHSDGIKFYISDNGVYLVDHVDPKYIEVARPS
jgi:putative RNA 2'-phosphotransferase